MTSSPAFDHIALAVPNLDEHVERLTSSLGLIATTRFDGFAVLIDPGTGIKFELSGSDDGEIRVRHLGFRADDVDAAHATLSAAGMETVTPPQRQEFAGMYASYIKQPNGLVIQLVNYD